MVVFLTTLFVLWNGLSSGLAAIAIVQAGIFAEASRQLVRFVCVPSCTVGPDLTCQHVKGLRAIRARFQRCGTYYRVPQCSTGGAFYHSKQSTPGVLAVKPWWGCRSRSQRTIRSRYAFCPAKPVVHHQGIGEDRCSTSIFID